MIHKTVNNIPSKYLRLLMAVGFVVLGLSSAHVAQAETYYVDALSGSNSQDGLTWETALLTIQSALSKSTTGDVVEISGGTYNETIDVHVPGITFQGSTESGHDSSVILYSSMFAFTARAGSVTLRHVTIMGGSTFFSKAVRVMANDVTIEDVLIDTFIGTGVSIESDSKNFVIRGVEIVNPSAYAISVDRFSTGRIDHSIARGYKPDSTTGAMIYLFGAGADVDMTNSFVAGGYRFCVKTESTARLTIHNSIIGGCGVEYTDQTSVHTLFAQDASIINIDFSILNGSLRAPHTSLSSGASLGSSVQTNVYPEITSLSADEAYLVFAVDAQASLENAYAMSFVMDGYGAHMSYFIESPNTMNEEDWILVRDMVSRGHDIGSRARTNHLLTNAGPFTITYTGSDTNVTASVMSAGTIFLTQGTTGVDTLGPFVLTDEAYATVDLLCAAISAHTSYTCTLIGNTKELQSDYPSTVLADQTIALSTKSTILSYDSRLPSQGGRFLSEAFIETKSIIETAIGNAYEVVSFAYPGQSHNNTIRDAVQEAGYLIARGAANYQNSDHLWASITDVYQTPITINHIQARGSDYDTLSDTQKQTRIREFGRMLAFTSMQSGMVAGFKVHAEDTFTSTQLEWLLSEVTQAGVTLVSMRELQTRLTDGWMTSDRRAYTKSLIDKTDLQPPAFSRLIDAGTSYDAVSSDASGNPIYGAPDIGPYEYQPTWSMGVDQPLVQQSTVLYEDGRFRALEQADGDFADISISPVGGFSNLSITQARNEWMRFEILLWNTNEDRSKQWTESGTDGLETTLHVIGDMTPWETYPIYYTKTGWAETLLTSATADADGHLSFLYTQGYEEDVQFDIRPDTTDPTVPGLLAPAHLTMLDNADVTLSWSDSLDSETGIQSYVIVLDGVETTVTPDQTQFLFSSLACGSYLLWSVTAVDGAGNRASSPYRLFTIRCGSSSSSAGGSGGNVEEPTTLVKIPVQEEPAVGGGGIRMLPSPVTGELEVVEEFMIGTAVRSPSFSTVYYVTADFKRAPFLNESIYYTWFEHMTEVQWVSDAALATLELTRPILPRSGSILVKSVLSPRVYALEAFGGDPTRPTLRWIPDEASATAWFGKQWNASVLDIDEIFLQRLTVGSQYTQKAADQLRHPLLVRTQLTHKSRV